MVYDEMEIHLSMQRETTVQNAQIMTIYMRHLLSFGYMDVFIYIPLTIYSLTHYVGATYFIQRRNGHRLNSH